MKDLMIKDLFEKDISRSINGVIKVEQKKDDEIYQELDEYVITTEVEKHLRSFYNAYTQSLTTKTENMGVWVSGFFGSGKSHFIKILSYLLSNKEVKNKKALDFFKQKCDDSLFIADMERAAFNGNNLVVLFNIGSKSDTGFRDSNDAIMKVMLKSFNEKIGYCRDIAWLAELERQLDKRGKYQSFKDEYHKVTGNVWEVSRDTFYFDRENIVAALAKVEAMTKDDAEKWFDNGENNYKPSIEKFAEMLKEYSEKHNKRIIFLIDEIGQYIGDRTDLMLDLQTVTEDLGIKLGGKAWIIVTSQEAIDKLTNIKGSDFSKIRGRFSTTLSLTSGNTDVVIQKRLLEKKEETKQALKLYFDEISASLKNLISFSAGTAEMKSFKNADEFASMYPFIPYQFNLLQKVFEQIRRIGAAGAHLAEGERSMLSAFQDSGKLNATSKVGILVPFSTFYQSIEGFLYAGIRRTINQAYDNSRLKPVDCELLKLLFMIKYIKEVRPNLENLTTLSLSSVTQDKITLREQIKTSLARLISETLIHQNGDEYEFLTDEEQELNREIKTIVIDETSIIEYAGKIIFDDIYPTTKYKYNSTNEYGFNKQLDGIHKGIQTHELTIKISTSWDNGAPSPVIDSTGDKIVIKLSDSDDFLSEIREYLQIQRFLTRKSSTQNSETIQKILDAKNRESNKAAPRIKVRIIDSICQSEVFIAGSKFEAKASDANALIDSTLRYLVENTYSKVDYVKVHTPYIEDIQRILRSNDIDTLSLFKVESGNNDLAINELNNYLGIQHDRNLKISAKTIKEKFNSKPYGWNEMDIAGLISGLFVRGDIKLRFNEENLDKSNPEIINYLTKANLQEKLIIKLKTKTDDVTVNQAKQVVRDLFGIMDLPEEETELLNKITELFRMQKHDLELKIAQYETHDYYPGEKEVERGVSLFEKVLEAKDEFSLFTIITELKDDLLTNGEDLEPVKGFFKHQITIFNEAKKLISSYARDFDYFDDATKEVVAKIKNILAMPAPYTRIKDLPILQKEIQDAHAVVLTALSSKLSSTAGSFKEDIVSELNDKELSDSFKESLLRPYDKLIQNSDQLTECSQIELQMSRLQQSKDADIASIYEELNKIAVAKIAAEKEAYKERVEPSVGTKQVEVKPIVKVKETKTIKQSQICKWDNIIENESDVDDYVSAVKKSMVDLLKDGKSIRLL